MKFTVSWVSGKRPPYKVDISLYELEAIYNKHGKISLIIDFDENIIQIYDS